jgi:DNA (cytosine-5)-methyltransferase 1
MTRGATMAGLKVKFGMDCWDVASKAWKANFPSAKMHKMWADQFYRLSPENQEFLVDILHLSPPCQTFSPAHTREGQNDEQNSASLFAVDRLLIKTRPRVVTLEQTFGILSSERHENYFKSLIRQFTDNGFSVEWRIVEFKRFGLAQMRKRLIITAAWYASSSL